MRNCIIGIVILAILAALASFPDEQVMAQQGGQNIRVGFHAGRPPLAFLDETGQVTGFEIELMEAIAEAEGFRIQWVISQEDLLAAVAAGNLDAAIGITGDETNVSPVQMSVPYYLNSLVIVSDEDETIPAARLEELGGRPVGVEAETLADDYLQLVGGVEVVTFSSLGDAAVALEVGQVVALVMSNDQAEQVVNVYGDWRLALTGTVLNDYYSIAVREEAPELVATINQGLFELYANGSYARLYQRYFGRVFVTRLDGATPEGVVRFYLERLFGGDLAGAAQAVCEMERGHMAEMSFEEFDSVNVDFSGLEYQVELDEEQARVSLAGTLRFDEGTMEVELQAADLFREGISLLQTGDGWRICPVESE